MNAIKILSLMVIISVVAGGCASVSREKGPATELHRGDAEPVFHDQRIKERLIEAGAKFMKSGEAVAMDVLHDQLKRTGCALDLPQRNHERLSVEAIAERCRKSVVVIGALYQCCGDTWRLDTGTGFVITESGAIGTCYHVINDLTHKTIVVMTSDGRVYPVKEVLAADETNDIAILRIEAWGLKPLALSVPARVGSRVFVIGHPDQKFYSMTEGIVSRYFSGQQETGDATMMSITADFGLGSSGCPIFNEFGAVVGMADNIVSTVSEIQDGKAKAGIVFKHCRPSASILKLIQPSHAVVRKQNERRPNFAQH